MAAALATYSAAQRAPSSAASTVGLMVEEKETTMVAATVALTVGQRAAATEPQTAHSNRQINVIYKK